MVFLANSTSTQKSDSPVVQVAKDVGPAVVGITNYQTTSNVYCYRNGFSFGPRNSSQKSQLVEIGTGSDTGNLTEVKLGDSSVLEVGEYIVAIGNPGGNEFASSVTAGVISATNRTITVSNNITLYNMLQTDAVINPGNSGGPLVNYSGEVIGINSAKYAEDGFEGMDFAVPISDAIPIIEQLIENGAAKHPALMVSVSDQ